MTKQAVNKDMFDFSTALKIMKEGKACTRMGWNNPSICVMAQIPDENSKMTMPYLYMEKDMGDGKNFARFPLDISAEGIFAEDWFEVA